MSIAGQMAAQRLRVLGDMKRLEAAILEERSIIPDLRSLRDSLALLEASFGQSPPVEVRASRYSTADLGQDTGFRAGDRVEVNAGTFMKRTGVVIREEESQGSYGRHVVYVIRLDSGGEVRMGPESLTRMKE